MARSRRSGSAVARGPCLALLVAGLVLAPAGPRAGVPAWLSGRPDVQEHAARARLYTHVFEDVAERCGIEAPRDSLARTRLVGATNAAVADWVRSRRDVYVARLPWLSLAPGGPWHCEFRLRGERIRRALATDDG